jgi:hypothetical protein
MVVAGSRCRAGWEGSVWGDVKAWAGERQDSRHAIRDAGVVVVAILVVVIRTSARFCVVGG